MGTKVTLKFHTGEVLNAIDSAASRKMNEAVNLVRNTTLETLSGSRRGQIRTVPGTRRTYTASAPGEAPAQASGELRQSVKTSIESKGKTIIGKVGTERKHGLHLEFGTKHMAARPWLKKSFEKSLSSIKVILSRKWF